MTGPSAVLLAALALLAAGAPAAGAATVTDDGGTLGYFPGAGEANRLTLSRSGDRLIAEDPGAASMGAAGTCTVAGPTTVTCPAAGVGDVLLQGGDGDDQLTNATGLGGTLSGGDGQDVLRGGDGAEDLEGGAGPDTLDGGAGPDRLYAATPQRPDAGADADALSGGAGDDRLYGGGGPNPLDGGTGDDQLYGNGGDDDLRGADGGDLVVGGDGNDRQDGGAGTDQVGTTATTGVEQAPQERGDDTLLGGTGDDTLATGPGPAAGTDADTLRGGDGDDAVSYGLRMLPVAASKDGQGDDGELGEHDDVGSDVEAIAGGMAGDRLEGGDGGDRLTGGPGDDVVAGGGGDDVLEGDGGTAAGEDAVTGGGGDDRIDGGPSGDTLGGDAGTDELRGGADDDTLDGGAGTDTLDGGTGEDAAAYSDAEQKVTVALAAGTGGTTTDDRDRLVAVEDARGGGASDTLTGDDGGNTLRGDDGEDYVDGLRGADRPDGGAGADVVVSRDATGGEPVLCGRGTDLAIVDRADKVMRTGVNRCEQVADEAHTAPAPGLVRIRPQRCAAGEVGLALPAMRRDVPLRYDVRLRSGMGDRPAPVLDAAHCPARLTATAGRGPEVTATVSLGEVGVAQTEGRRRVTTTLSVVGPACGRGGADTARAAESRRSRVRLRTGHRRGRWRVKGRFSFATSVATDWTTIESCSSTTTVVRRGAVRLVDRARHRTVIVRAGHSYVARRR